MKKENRLTIGIKKSEEKKVVKKEPRKFFNKWVKDYFDFCREKFGEDPSFDGASPRWLGMIYDQTEKRCLKNNAEWTEDISRRMWKMFLKVAWSDPYRQRRFTLSSLNAGKDIIFSDIKKFLNGQSKTHQPNNSSKSGTGKGLGTSDARIERARNW